MEDSKNTHKPEGVIIGQSFKRNKIRQLFSGKGKIIWRIAVVIALVTGSTGIYLLYRHNNQPISPDARLDGKKYSSYIAEQIESQKLSATATPQEKVNHYGLLTTYQYGAGDYDGATKSYQQFLAAITQEAKPVNHQAYVSAAQAYAKLGNIAEAQRVLDVAQEFDEALTDPISRSDALSILAEVRKALE